VFFLGLLWSSKLKSDKGMAFAADDGDGVIVWDGLLTRRVEHLAGGWLKTAPPGWPLVGAVHAALIHGSMSAAIGIKGTARAGERGLSYRLSQLANSGERKSSERLTTTHLSRSDLLN
jgi:hypothetical protein